MHPVMNGTVFSRGENGTYTNPGAPLYVVQGTSGAFVSGDWMEPQPACAFFAALAPPPHPHPPSRTETRREKQLL